MNVNEKAADYIAEVARRFDLPNPRYGMHVEPNTYHNKQELEKARRNLDKVLAWNDEQWRKEYSRSKRAYEVTRVEINTDNARKRIELKSLFDEISAWPTDLEDIKNRALQDIADEQSHLSDLDNEFPSFDHWKAKKIEYLQGDESYHEERIRTKQERASEINKAWEQLKQDIQWFGNALL